MPPNAYLQCLICPITVQLEKGLRGRLSESLRPFKHKCSCSLGRSRKCMGGKPRMLHLDFVVFHPYLLSREGGGQEQISDHSVRFLEGQSSEDPVWWIPAQLEKSAVYHNLGGGVSSCCCVMFRIDSLRTVPTNLSQ